MAKPATPWSDRDAPPRLTASVKGQMIPEDEAVRVAQTLGELLDICRNACDSNLAHEQPVGTFRVEET